MKLFCLLCGDEIHFNLLGHAKFHHAKFYKRYFGGKS